MITFVLLENLTDKRGRKYDRAEVEYAIAKNPSFYGQLGSPTSINLDLGRMSHEVRNLRFEGDNLVGDVVILDTITGAILKSLVDNRAALSTSIRALGVVDDQNNVTKLSLDGFDIIGVLYDSHGKIVAEYE